ncbi:uncharacterized protein LOC121504308 [Cheilinus undulatus]|uniref:uncharacterized protein LOC121504308 n=1 Tax=Cheilinus undulatus TaxID=241271 RepID=UPI001BD2FF47|nr:uncharacterized protein LOC121504308 [Cheilinus undulatus]
MKIRKLPRLPELLLPYEPSRTLRSSGSGLLVIPKVRTHTHGEASFQNYGPRLEQPARGPQGRREPQKEGNALEKHPCYPDMCELLRELDAMAAKLKALKNTVRKNQNQITELQDKERTKVIFSAALGGTGAFGPFNAATTLKYTVVITNIGNAYNSATGIFTAPVAGVYYFTFFVHAEGTRLMLLALFKNSQTVVMTHDQVTGADGADNGGNAAFLRLQRGDQVFVQMLANSHVWRNEVSTTFSGFLVTQM